MKNKIVFGLMALLLAVLIIPIACSTDNGGFFGTGFGTSYVLTDANGDPIAFTFYSITGLSNTALLQTEAEEGGFLNHIDITTGLLCDDPTGSTPNSADGDTVDTEGCTSATGGITVPCVVPDDTFTANVDDGAGTEDVIAGACPPEGEDGELDPDDPDFDNDLQGDEDFDDNATPSATPSA